ncbi:MAG: alpha/beta hydrolase [Desulfobacterales bacterium]
MPPADRPPVVIGSHGLLSDKNSPKQLELAQHCNQKHIAYFRFDHCGCGESEGKFNTVTSLKTRCADLMAAAKMLKGRDDIGARVGLFGSSMGGTVCLSSARRINADAVVTWAAPIRSIDMVRSQTNPAGQATTSESKHPFKANPFDISHLLAGIQNTLIFHGDADETVPLTHATEIYELVSEPKKLVIVPQSDHRMSNPDDQQAFMREALRWFQTYLTLE